MLQASPQKIDLHHLLAHLSFQRSDTIFIGAIPARSGKRLGAKLAQLAPPAVQNVRVFRPAEDEDLGSWLGLAPDGCSLLTRDIGTQEVYDLSVHWH